MTDTTQERRTGAGIHYGAAPEVKQKHRAMWALGDYPAVAARHRRAARARCSSTPASSPPATGCSTSRPAPAPSRIPAAEAGASVTASDLTPELLAVGERTARAEGLDVTWEEGDAEALPYADGAFDVTTSCVGVMFAPFHQAAADELVRVTRPGGRIGLVSWTPEGFIGQMFSVMRPYAPPPPPGAQPPPLWGAEAHVRELLGDRVDDGRDHPPAAAGRPLRRRRGVPRLLQGELRPDDRRLPRDRRRPRPGRRRWTPRWPTSATGTSTTASWTGSTCCSPPAGADRPTADAGPPARRAPRHPPWSPHRPHRAPHRGCRCGSLRSAA